MYSSQTTESAFNSIAPYVLIALIVGIVFVIIMIIFFVKIWNACTDLAKMRPLLEDIKQIFEEVHPVIEDGADDNNKAGSLLKNQGISKDSTSSHENM